MNINSNPIVIRMAGGLANRMFQYSYYLYLKNKGYNVYVDNNYKAKLKTENFSWNKIFSNAPITQAPVNLILKYGGGYDLLSKIRRHCFKFTSRVYITSSAFVIPSDRILENYYYLIGVFQDYRIVESVKDNIVSKFKFNSFEDKYNKSLKETMANCMSVSIHVRKGKDYLQRECYKGTCDIDYYQNAVAYIKAHVSSPKFYVFTDNPSWVKDNFKYFDYTLVEHNPVIGFGNHFDMQLMSCCKHNIIANSTYSWWGAYLNSNKEKIVIGPTYWFNKNMEIYRELQNVTLCKNWIAL